MQPSRILSLVGTSIAIVTIVLGIVALSTKTWIILVIPTVFESTYSLFERCNKTWVDGTTVSLGCKSLNELQTAQGLIIAGVVILGLSMIASIILGVLLDNRWIKLIPHYLHIVGPTLILVGAVFYVKNVLGNFTAGSAKLDLGYSFILILVTCIIGYVAVAYFSFITGFSHGQHHESRMISSFQ